MSPVVHRVCAGEHNFPMGDMFSFEVVADMTRLRKLDVWILNDGQCTPLAGLKLLTSLHLQTSSASGVQSIWVYSH